MLIFDWMPMRVLCRPERWSVVLVVRRWLACHRHSLRPVRHGRHRPGKVL